MKRLLFLVLSIVLVSSSALQTVKAGAPIVIDNRSFITAIDQTKHTFTVTNKGYNKEDTYTLADPLFYHIEVDIDGAVKSFADLKTGMLYVTSTDVAPGVVSVIVAKSAPPALVPAK